MGFGANTVVLAVAGLLMIPAIVGAGGAKLWAAVALGQAVGAFSGVLVGFGWGIAGPSYVARAGASERKARYLESLYGRLLVAAAVFPIAGVLAGLIAPNDPSEAVLGCLTVAVVAWGPSWYYVGRSRPYAMLLLDTAPKVFGAFTAIFSMSAGAPVNLGLLIQMAGILLGTVCSSLYILLKDSRSQGGWPSLRGVFAALRSQVPGVTASSVSAAYSAAPIVIIGSLFPIVLTMFAAFDKLQKQFSSAVSPVVQVLQGYVARGASDELSHRSRSALISVLTFGCLGFVLFAFVGRSFLDWMTRGAISFPYASVLLLAALLMAIVVEQTLGRAVLSAFGKLRALAIASSVGALTGIVSATLLAALLGATAALGGLLLGTVTSITLEYREFAKASHERRGTRDLQRDPAA